MKGFLTSSWALIKYKTKFGSHHWGHTSILYCSLATAQHWLRSFPCMGVPCMMQPPSWCHLCGGIRDTGSGHFWPFSDFVSNKLSGSKEGHICRDLSCLMLDIYLTSVFISEHKEWGKKWKDSGLGRTPESLHKQSQPISQKNKDHLNYVLLLL